MSKSKLAIWLVTAVTGVLLGFVWLRPDGNVHVVACDVGQGDGMLIFRGSTQVLVDAGPGDAILSCLSTYVPFWDKQIEMVVATNGDADHVTGFISVLQHYQVGKMIANNMYQNTARFRALREEIIKDQVEVYAPEQGDEIRMTSSTGRTSRAGSAGITSSAGGAEMVFQVLWPEEYLGDPVVWTQAADARVLGANTYGKDSNEKSVVLKLTYGDFDVLLTGDAGEPTETTLLGEGKLGPVEVLKVGHHGSRYSSTEAFLGALQPKIAMISVGATNRYGHPTQEALERLGVVGAKVLRTDQVGNVEVVSDGKNYWVK